MDKDQSTPAETTGLPLYEPEEQTGAREKVAVETDRTDKAQRQEIFLPVSGFVWFYPEEIHVINHPAFQRLARIYQLGQAHYVFPGATHRRKEHVLGAVSVVQRMIAAVKFNAERAKQDQAELPEDQQDWRDPLSEEEERFVRLGALLHDIGHLAAGHTLEDELGLFGKHDEDARLDYIFGDVADGHRPDWGTEVPVKPLGELIDEHYAKYLPASLKKYMSPSRLVRLLIRKCPEEGDNYADAQGALAASDDIRLAVCTNMIGNTICADLLDYIARDWYHVGKPVASEDRIFQYMEIRNEAKSPDSSAWRSSSDAFVLSLGSDTGRAPKIRTDGVSAILALLERRYELAETVLYHKTKLAAGAMLGRALFELWEGKDVSRDLLMLSDEQLIDHALREAEEQIAQAGGRQAKRSGIQERARAAAFLLKRLPTRELYRCFYTARSWSSLTSSHRERLTELFAPSGDATGQGAKNRTRAARVLEEVFELPCGSIVVSCTNVKPKIAQVEIRVNGRIRKFSEHEDHERGARRWGLSGGHLNAQIQRFHDLWRLDFFIAKDVKDDLEANAPDKYELLQDAVEAIVIQPPSSDEALRREAARIALSYKTMRQVPLAAKSGPDRYSPPDLASIWDGLNGR